MTKRDQDHGASLQLDRRQMLLLGAGLAVSATGCGDRAINAAVKTLGGPRTPGDLLAGIDTVIVLMMENRSFDHIFGMLKHDPQYPSPHAVECLHGNESNPDAHGGRVPSYHLTSLTQADPPHSWAASHAQWNGGKNDGFVRQHHGAQEKEVMGYFTRNELPFTYWLADNFTLCDHWFASVMGPTYPNRAVLHAADASGLKKNDSLMIPPLTIWDVLPTVGKYGKNYYAGKLPIFPALYPAKVLAGVNPMAAMDEFFVAARLGLLPPFVMIDPDYETNDDHPAHNVHLGQALIASIYQALAASPQWSRCLFVITYDEHGGFYDHVPPPECGDADPDFRQLGFRVPALVIGPTVRRGAVCSAPFEHASVAATLKTRYGIPSLSRRMDTANDLSACIDPEAVGAPRQPPSGAPVITLPSPAELLASDFVHGQPELAAMLAAGRIPAEAVDSRTRAERMQAWLETAHALGAVQFR